MSDLHAEQHSHLMQEFPTLVLKAQTYTYPDGRSATLLMVEGTLPMYYQVGEACAAGEGGEGMHLRLLRPLALPQCWPACSRDVYALV